MEKLKISFLSLFVLALFLFSAGCTQDQPGETSSTPLPVVTSPEVRYTSNETLVAFVDSAAAYVRTQGTKKAIAEFNNPNGSFIQGELYIYAYGFNGTTLAHPINPEKVGKNRLDEGEIGVFVRQMGEEVRSGSGFYRFTYINPAHNRTIESKMGYGVKIDDDWWLGSGVYTGPAEPGTPNP